MTVQQKVPPALLLEITFLELLKIDLDEGQIGGIATGCVSVLGMISYVVYVVLF